MPTVTKTAGYNFDLFKTGKIGSKILRYNIYQTKILKTRSINQFTPTGKRMKSGNRSCMTTLVIVIIERPYSEIYLRTQGIQQRTFTNTG